MGEERPVQQHGAWRAAPPCREHRAHAVHGVDRHHAERMIEEMPDDEAGDDEAGGEPQPALKPPHCPNPGESTAISGEQFLMANNPARPYRSIGGPSFRPT